jgi:hypothetical protein
MHAGDQLLLSGRYTTAADKTVSFSGMVDGTPFVLSQFLSFPGSAEYDPAVQRYWGAKKIQSLLELIESGGEQQELIDQVIALSIRYSVLTPYTAFLVVEPEQSTVSVDDGLETPADFQLLQNYPNPFNPSTTIRYRVPADVSSQAFVTVEILDVLGRRIATLVARLEAPGTYEVVWHGKNDRGEDVPSGVYYCRLVVGHRTAVKTMLLMK